MDWFGPITTPAPTNAPPTGCTMVDGVPDTDVYHWHRLADKDGDGEITGAEARDFFFRTGLQRQTLSQIWQQAIKNHNGGLGIPQFVVALRLVGCAQAGQDITDPLGDLARLAPGQRAPLPTPKLEGWGSAPPPAAPPSPLPAPVVPPQPAPQPFFPPAAPPPAYASPVKTVQTPAVGQGQGQGFPSALPSPPPYGAARASDPGVAAPLRLPCPAVVPIRLPPLQRAAGDLCALAGYRGSLLAGPSGQGGLLQYGNAEGELSLPPGGQRCRTEDRDSAPCHEGPPHDGVQALTALTADHESGLVVSGHRDGTVVCWAPMSQSSSPSPSLDRAARFQAHKYGCVSALCVAPGGGVVWTGSSWGSLRAWQDLPGAIRAFGSAGLPLSPSSIELKRFGADAAHDDTQFIALATASGPGAGLVLWSAGVHSLCLWDAEDGTYLGHIHEKGSDGLPASYPLNTEAGLDLDPRTGRPVSVVPVEALVLERNGGQPTTTMGMGLRNIVKLTKNITKVAASVSQNVTGQMRVRAAEDLYNDSPSSAAHPLGVIRGLVAAADGTVWVGYRGSRTHGSGFMESYYPNGRLRMLMKTADGVTCLRAIGARVWAGLASGHVQVWDLSMAPLATVGVHVGPVKDITHVGARAYTLGVDNCINCLDASTPSPRDALLVSSVEGGLVASRGRAQLAVLVGTWNVAEKKGTPQGVGEWVGARCKGADLVVLSLQEIEMGGSSVVMGAAKDLVASSMQEKGNATAQAWAQLAHQALLDGDASAQWERVGLRQMSGILVMVFARREVAPWVGKVETASVACGVLGVGGNKGGVGVRLSLYRRTCVFVGAHFAAHQENVQKRNENYATIIRNMNFSARRQQEAAGGQASQGQGQAAMLRSTPTTSSAGGPPMLTSQGSFGTGGHDFASSFTDSFAGLNFGRKAKAPGDASPSPPPEASLSSAPGTPPPGPPDEAAAITALDEAMGPVGTISSADFVVFAGDFNYRIDGGYEEVVEAARAGRYDALKVLDQLGLEARAGRVFQGMEEGMLSFPPTYKFDKGVPGMQYDSSEKRRVPAWTDRVFFRGTPRGAAGGGGGAVSDQQPVRVTCQEYNCVLDVTESDHKPVFARLSLDLPFTHWDILRGQLLAGLAQVQPPPSDPAADLSLSPDSVVLANAFKGTDAATLCVANRGPHHAMFRVVQPTRPLRAPWIRADPEQGVVLPSSQRFIDLRAVLQSGSKEDTLVVELEDEFGGQRANCAAPRSARVAIAVGVGAGGGGGLARGGTYPTGGQQQQQAAPASQQPPPGYAAALSMGSLLSPSQVDSGGAGYATPAYQGSAQNSSRAMSGGGSARGGLWDDANWGATAGVAPMAQPPAGAPGPGPAPPAAGRFFGLLPPPPPPGPAQGQAQGQPPSSAPGSTGNLIDL